MVRLLTINSMVCFLKSGGRVWWCQHMAMPCWEKKKFRQWLLLIRDKQGAFNETIYSCFEIWQFFFCWRQTITDACLWTNWKFSSKAVHVYLIADLISPTHLAVYSIIVLLLSHFPIMSKVWWKMWITSVWFQGNIHPSTFKF